MRDFFFGILPHMWQLTIFKSVNLIALRHGKSYGQILRRQAWLSKRNPILYEFPDHSVVEKCDLYRYLYPFIEMKQISLVEYI